MGSFHTIATQGVSGAATSSWSGRSVRTGAASPLTCVPFSVLAQKCHMPSLSLHFEGLSEEHMPEAVDSMHGMGTRQLQHLGEESAARHLKARGLRILARNWRIKQGELDIVAADGSILVFVEVKARRTGDFVDPAEGVDYRKQVRLRRLADAYLAIERPRFSSCRFDVVSVVADSPRPLVHHLVDAF